MYIDIVDLDNVNDSDCIYIYLYIYIYVEDIHRLLLGAGAVWKGLATSIKITITICLRHSDSICASIQSRHMYSVSHQGNSLSI